MEDYEGVAVCTLGYRRLERHGWCKKSIFLSFQKNGNASAGGGGIVKKKYKILRIQKLMGVKLTCYIYRLCVDNLIFNWSYIISS